MCSSDLIEVEEHKCIEESLQKKLEESNQEREALEAEVVSLRKEVKDYRKLCQQLKGIGKNHHQSMILQRKNWPRLKRRRSRTFYNKIQ